MDTEQTTLSIRKSLQHSKMLVSKFGFERDGRWHIQWPTDLPQVIHAATKEDLVIKLATRLIEIGRVANEGKHVDPEYP